MNKPISPERLPGFIFGIILMVIGGVTMLSMVFATDSNDADKVQHKAFYYVGMASMFFGVIAIQVSRARSKEDNESEEWGLQQGQDEDLGTKTIVIKCQQCGKLNEETAKFCNECGKPI